jgi:ParB-like chromosome segregation protein Spo0J
MSTIEVRQVKLASIKLNKDNPRRISTRDMDRLVKSLQEFPDMLREKA